MTLHAMMLNVFVAMIMLIVRDILANVILLRWNYLQNDDECVGVCYRACVLPVLCCCKRRFDDEQIPVHLNE